MPLRSLMLDFNSYFASVEQQMRPELRGKPVVVVPVMADTTCVIALSQEAKLRQVKRGMRVAVARCACPELKVIEARPSLYVEIHQQFVGLVESCIHVDNVLSIDEMVCNLTGNLRQQENAIELAKMIKRTIAKNAGTELRCSIGIAPNPFLAKTATDMQKPDGLVVLEQQDLPQILYKMELRDLSGVGSQMEKRLKAKGINTTQQLCAASKNLLRGIWGGIEGERMFNQLRGELVQRQPTHKTSIGHSHVLSPAQRNDEDALAVLHRLLQKAAMRLRKIKHFATRMQLFIEYAERGGYSHDISFLETHDTLELTRIFKELWNRRPQVDQRPLMVGVTLVGLVSTENFTPSFLVKNREQLNSMIDQLNARFGKSTVYFGGAHRAKDSAPMRIAFNYVPDLNTDRD